MTESFYLLLFFFGASLGSFYITTAERVLLFFYGRRRKEGSTLNRFLLLFTEPSHCNHCGKTLKSYSLLPILGYIFQKGKCTFCKKQISWLYPTSELLFGLTTPLAFALTNSILFTIFFPILLGHLLISIYTDANFFSLDYENLPFIAIAGILCNYGMTDTWPTSEDFYVFLGFLVFYLLLYFLVKQGMGLGDVLFAPCFAFLAGHPFWLFFLNAAYMLALAVTFITRKRGETLRKKPIPMGVYFSIALFFTFIAKILFYIYGLDNFVEVPDES